MLKGSRLIVPAMTLLALGLVIAPSSAIATPQDVASTHAYILANFAFVRASEARAGLAQAKVLKLDRRLDRECPNAGAGSPQNEEEQKLSYEAAGAIWSITYGADAGPIALFIRAVKPLRWSNPALTRIAQGYLKSLHELASLPLPAICTDVRTWSETSFRTIPANTASFDQYVESIEGHSIPQRLLASYELPSDRSMIKLIARLETTLEHTETVTGFNDWDALLEVLGLHQ